MPPDLTEAKEKTIIFCSLSSTRDFIDDVYIHVLRAPDMYIGGREMETFSFDEPGVMGGRYFFVCIMSDSLGPVFAKLREITVFGEFPSTFHPNKMEIFNHLR